MTTRLGHGKNRCGAQAYWNVCIRCQATQRGVSGFALLHTVRANTEVVECTEKSHVVCSAHHPGIVGLAPNMLGKTGLSTTRWGKIHSHRVGNQSELDWYCSSQKAVSLSCHLAAALLPEKGLMQLHPASSQSSQVSAISATLFFSI